MTISEIYNKYSIPQNLQEHMLRVAAVGLQVVELLEPSISLDRKVVADVLLLHDMGNIIKFNLDKDDLLGEEERGKLKKIQKDFIAKYGQEEHAATENIAKELGVSDQVLVVLSNIGSSKVYLTIESDDWYRKVCSYADFRVAPHGVVSINERWDDVIKRYEGRDHVLADIAKCEEKRRNCLILEKQIQDKANDQLNTITTENIEPTLKELRDYII